MEKFGNRSKTPPQIVDAFEAYLNAKIGTIAEDDWLLLDDFVGYCEAVRREWQKALEVSIANPDVKRDLLRRCTTNLRRAEASFAAMVNAYVLRKS